MMTSDIGKGGCVNRRQRTVLAITVVVVVALLVARTVALFPLGRIVAPHDTGGQTSSVARAAAPASSTAIAPAGANESAIDTSQLDPRVTQATVAYTIGVSGWSKRVRPSVDVTRPIKLRLMCEHGYTAPTSAYELDHFIPLEVGGSSDLSNLWLEPIAEARAKDRDENFVHRKVVTGEWTLAQGQQYIRDHWRIYYAPASTTAP